MGLWDFGWIGYFANVKKRFGHACRLLSVFLLFPRHIRGRIFVVWQNSCLFQRSIGSRGFSIDMGLCPCCSRIILFCGEAYAGTNFIKCTDKLCKTVLVDIFDRFNIRFEVFESHIEIFAELLFVSQSYFEYWCTPFKVSI